MTIENVWKCIGKCIGKYIKFNCQNEANDLNMMYSKVLILYELYLFARHHFWIHSVGFEENNKDNYWSLKMYGKVEQHVLNKVINWIFQNETTIGCYCVLH